MSTEGCTLRSGSGVSLHLLPCEVEMEAAIPSTYIILSPNHRLARPLRTRRIRLNALEPRRHLLRMPGRRSVEPVLVTLQQLRHP